MLENKNYFSKENQIKYFSVSQFKAFEKCQAAALAEISCEYVQEITTPMLVGSYVDAYFEGTLDLFKKNNPLLFKKDGTLKAEYINADKIINRIKKDDMFMYYMSGEKQVIMTGQIENVPIKIKIDSYHKDKMIVDLKCMKDFKPIYKAECGRMNWVEAWEYDLQGAVYQEVVRQNTGKVLPFFIAAVTKEKEPDLAIISVGQEYLDFQLEKVKKNIQMYDAVKHGIIESEGCGHCDYCKSVKLLKNYLTLEELDFDYTD